MSAVWPCSACGAPGARNFAANGYCSAHAAELLASLSPEAWLQAGGGVGLPGLARLDHGPGFCELTCSCCEATWVGHAFTRCPWCVEHLELLEGWQADALLVAPDVDPDDRLYEPRMKAWADRLARGVESGLLERPRALAAWRKAVGRVAA